MSTSARPSIVGITDRDLTAAVTGPQGIARLAARIEASGATVIVIGADRLSPEDGDGHTPRLDPTTAALALGRALPEHGLIVAAAPTREHPYNVARRVLSLDHVLDGRVGLLVGRRDHGVPEVDHEHDPAEFAEVIRGLWRTWPRESIVGDRDSGQFVRAESISTLDHDGGPGGYRVRGPLTTPSSRQGEPVLAVWHDVRLPTADLVLGGLDRPLAALPIDDRTPSASDGRTPVAHDRRGPHPTLRALLDLDVPIGTPAAVTA